MPACTKSRPASTDATERTGISFSALTVSRFGWQFFSFVLMPNHFHLFLRTPQPSLSRGMQSLASGYANWFAKRHRSPGHLLHVRFKSQLPGVDFDRVRSR